MSLRAVVIMTCAASCESINCGRQLYPNAVAVPGKSCIGACSSAVSRSGKITPRADVSDIVTVPGRVSLCLCDRLSSRGVSQRGVAIVVYVGASIVTVRKPHRVQLQSALLMQTQCLTSTGDFSWLHSPTMKRTSTGAFLHVHKEPISLTVINVSDYWWYT